MIMIISLTGYMSFFKATYFSTGTLVEKRIEETETLFIRASFKFYTLSILNNNRAFFFELPTHDLPFLFITF
jgi:hypothetical protein